MQRLSQKAMEPFDQRKRHVNSGRWPCSSRYSNSGLLSASVQPSKPTRTQEVQRRILVVDDNTDAAELMAELFQRSGHSIAVAHDGPSALEVAATFAPEVAILDIGLPIMDGYELARRLREQLGATVHLVALTGYGQASDRDRAKAAGFDVHLVKPVDAAALRAAINPA